MAELGAAALGVGAAFGAAAYISAKGFVGRHESNHAVQVSEMKHHIADFEAAYARGDVAEEDWRYYRQIRTEANELELEYEESIDAYKMTPMYRFLDKWSKKHQVRRKKNAVRKANRKLRSHYSDCSSAASDASSTIAASGSPPRSRKTYSDEDDQSIVSWAMDVEKSASDTGSERIFKSPTLCVTLSKQELPKRRKPHSNLRCFHDLICDERAAKQALYKVLPAYSEKSELRLERRAVQHIIHLNKVVADLRQRIQQIALNQPNGYRSIRHPKPQVSLLPCIRRACTKLSEDSNSDACPGACSSARMDESIPIVRRRNVFCRYASRDGHAELKELLSFSPGMCILYRVFTQAKSRILELENEIRRLQTIVKSCSDSGGRSFRSGS